MTGVELLQNGIGRTLGFLGRAGAMISITLLSRAEDEPEYQIHIDTGVSKSFLLREYRRARAAKVTRDCRSFGCNACGWERRGCEWSAANA